MVKAFISASSPAHVHQKNTKETTPIMQLSEKVVEMKSTNKIL